jgi:hypothetical protein
VSREGQSTKNERLTSTKILLKHRGLRYIPCHKLNHLFTGEVSGVFVEWQFFFQALHRFLTHHFMGPKFRTVRSKNVSSPHRVRKAKRHLSC